MGIDPNPDEIPMQLSDLSEFSVLAFELYEFLPDRWEGFNATYLGKDFNLLPFLFQQYDVSKKEIDLLLYLLRLIDVEVSTRVRKKQDSQRKSQEAKQKWQQR